MKKIYFNLFLSALSIVCLILGYRFYAQSLLKTAYWRVIPYDQTYVEELSHEQNKTVVPIKEHRSLAKCYCNTQMIDTPHKLDEGKGRKGWKLKQVQIVIRHGDRAPLNFNLYSKQNVHPNFCNIFSDNVKTNGILKEFRKSISQDLQGLSQSGLSKLGIFAHPLPDAAVCSSGQLSSIGVLQHLTNGLLLRQAYIEKLKFLNLDQVSRSLRVQSTHVRRTLQSAVAFLYGFLPGYHLKQIPIFSNSRLLFCGNKCSCPLAAAMQNKIKKVQYSVYVNRQKKNETIRRISSMLFIDDHSGSMIDALVTGYLCKEIKLPCTESGLCVHEKDLDAIMDEHDNLNRVLLEDSPLRNSSMLLIHPMLELFSQRMQQAINGNEGALPVALYSGHDLTLKPLLAALGHVDYRWPPLGTRLVFELWESAGTHFLKIIYNGQDITHKTYFCPGSLDNNQRCMYDTYAEYVRSGIAKHFGFASRDEACRSV